MGAFQSVPDDVLTVKLAPYLIGGPIVSLEPEQLLVVRETCKSGRDLVQLTFNNTALHMPVNFKPPPEPDGLYPAEPLEMRVSAQVVEAMGRVFGPLARPFIPAVAPRRESQRSNGSCPERAV